MDNEEAQEDPPRKKITVELSFQTPTSRSKRRKLQFKMKPPTAESLPGLGHAFDDDEERLVRRHREAAFIEIEEDEDIAGVVNSGFGPEMMEVDDREDPVDVLVDLDKHLHPVDSDFFNSFADDFDDTDLS